MIHPEPWLRGIVALLSVTIDWFTVSRILCKWNYILVLFRVCFLSLSMVFLRFTKQWLAILCVPFFIMLSSVSRVGCVTICLSTHVLMNKCFQFLDIVNKGTLNICIEVLAHTHVSIFLGCGLHQNLQTGFQSGWAILHPYQQGGRVPATCIFAST